MTVHPLFVYGTLLSHGAHPLMRHAVRAAPATTVGTLWAMPEGYPALQLEGDTTVHGELVHPVPDTVLAALDAYEGVDEGLYVRRLIPALTATGETIAWSWIMEEPSQRGGTLCSTGRWHQPGRPRSLR